MGATVWQAGKCIATGDFEPFCDGVKQAGNSLYHLVRHPIDSAVTMVEGAAIISYHLGKLFVQTEYTNMLFYVDPAHALRRTIDMTTNMDEIGIDLCKKFQEIPERELIVNATAFATETAALHYGGTALGKLVASAGVAAKTSGIFERVKQLIQPIKEELQRIAQAAKEFFKSKKEIAFALEGGESIGMEVTDALVESVGAETITQTIPKMPKVIKNALPHIFSDEQQLIQLIDKFANTVFNLPMHAA